MSVPRGPFSPAGTHRWKRPAAHSSHVRQAGTMQKPTWSPGATCVTAEPTASTTRRPRGPAPWASVRRRARRPPGARPSGTRRPRRRGRAPRRRAAARARPPRRRADCRGSCRTAARIRISRSGTARARRSRARRRARARRAADRAVRRDLEGDGEEPVAPLGRPRRRVERNLEVRAGRERERRVQVREQPVAVRPRVRAPRAPERRRRAPRSAPRAADAAGRARRRAGRRRRRRGSTRSRASAVERTISPAAMRIARAARQRARSPRRRRSAAAPRASTRRGARARARTRRPSRASQRGVRSPGMRQPWFASTMTSSSGTALAHRLRSRGGRRASRCEWRRSFTARTPASRSATQRRTRSSASTSSPLDAYARIRSRSPPSRRQTGSSRARPTRSQTATSTIQLRPWWKSTVSTIPWTASVSDDVEADEQPLEQLAVGQRVAARVALDAVVGADDHDRRLLGRPRLGVPGGEERRLERVAVAPRLDRRDAHHSPE